MIGPGIFGVPPGADFPQALVSGLVEWARGRPPDALARVTVYVNTRRMQRRVRSLFDGGPALLLPRLRLVTELDREPAAVGLPPAPPPLQRTLELARLVRALIAAEPDLAAENAVFDLAASLSTLLDEMHGEGVLPEVIGELDVSDQSGHWARSQKFLSLVAEYTAATKIGEDQAQRLRLATERMIAHWADHPPSDPVIVAGSTGSRGTTAMLMAAVATLPTGSLILPGFDFDMPPALWDTLRRDAGAEDHPQFRFARLLHQLGVDHGAVARWPGAEAPDPARNRLVSLSLRPAPVTDQWLRDGPDLGDLRDATQGITLVEAASARDESLTIALILRGAAEEGQTAALVSPDRMLTRRVTAHLDRWGIEPDDSAGRPLALSAPGRFLLHIATLVQRRPSSAEFVALLKHPLCHSGADRNRHLLCTRDLELHLRRNVCAFASAETVGEFSTRHDADGIWLRWAMGLLSSPASEAADMGGHARTLLGASKAAAAGSMTEGSGALWDKDAGRKARIVLDTLLTSSAPETPMTAQEFERLLRALLEAEDVRDRDKPHPGIMIWGTLEARVQGADLVVLGGLNEGSWPDAPAPDPWLNRAMRARARLLLPERRIGLSAHDYQQAIAAPEVVMTRAVRSNDGEPLPSRWLNRLTNLLAGLTDTGGTEALAAMRARGAMWSARAALIEAPLARLDPEPRPAPRPPVAARPDTLYVTAIQRLIRDPYAVYARYILGLRKLAPLVPAPDAPLRGQIIHDILDTYMRDRKATASPDAVAELMHIADQVLDRAAPWALARQIWRARIARVADWYVADEARRADHSFRASEIGGKVELPEAGFTLRAKADRIDDMPGGRLAIIDYKTGAPPTKKEIEHFDKQLLLEALIAEAGGFDGIDAAPVDHVAHIGLGREPKYTAHWLVDDDGQSFALPTVRASLVRLLLAYADRSRGYAARPAMQKVLFEGDYDHLARFGEWDDTDPPHPEDVG